MSVRTPPSSTALESFALTVCAITKPAKTATATTLAGESQTTKGTRALTSRR